MLHSGDANEEFVSESYRVSSKDMAEVDESMKRLGVGGTGGKGKSGTSGGGDVDDNDWENELEVILNGIFSDILYYNQQVMKCTKLSLMKSLICVKTVY